MLARVQSQPVHLGTQGGGFQPEQPGRAAGAADASTPVLEATLRAVSIGEVDAYVTEMASAAWQMQQEGITNLTVAGESGFIYEIGFACRRDWPEFVGIFEKGLALISDEERRRLRGDVRGILQKGEYDWEELVDHIRDAIAGSRGE